MYVQKTDYRSYLTIQLLDMVTEQVEGEENPILSDASAFAEGIIKTYTGSLFDITGELAKTGSDRNYLVLSWAVHIAVYVIHQRIADDTVPEKVIKNYDDTIADLQRVSAGKLPLNLPPTPSTMDPETGSAYTGLRRINSDTPRSHRL